MWWALAVLLIPAAASAQGKTNQSGHLGLGLGLGSHVAGLSGKWVPANSHAIQFLVGASRTHFGPALGYNTPYGDPAVELDYLYRMPTLLEEESVSLGWTLGMGGTIGTSGPFVSAQGIAGITVDLQEVPVDFTAEIRPGLLFTSLTGHLGFALDLGAHIRVWI